MMRVQSQNRLIALGGTLLAFVISACSAGIVAVSRDTLKIYTRGGERLKKNHEEPTKDLANRKKAKAVLDGAVKLAILAAKVASKL